MTDGIVFRTVSLVREQLGDRKEYQSLFDLSDEDVARYLFRSFRKSGVHIRGLRLSNLGLDVLSQCFTSYVIKRPEGRENLREILYLDRHCTLPYFYSATKIVLFETVLGTALIMSDGDFHILDGFEG
jgi:hypothetical protein